MHKFITLTDYLTSENRKKVFPFLFDYHYLRNPILMSSFTQVDDFKDADFAIFPLDIRYVFETKQEAVLYEFIKNAKEFKIPVCVYSAGDFGMTLPQDIVTFRMGGFKSNLNKNTFILPSFLNDPIADFFENNWKASPKSTMPTVGFVGHASGTISKYLKEYLIYLRHSMRRKFGYEFSDKQSFFPSGIKRYKILKKLEKNKKIATDFIFRKKYRAGATTQKQREVSTFEFFENINRNLYTFCLRGSGNFSVRFYETLLMGRIPVLVNTDCRLPLEEIIDWKNHCVFATTDKIESALLDFHHSKSETDLAAIQEANRKLALEQLNRICYFIRVFENLLVHKNIK